MNTPQLSSRIGAARRLLLCPLAVIVAIGSSALPAAAQKGEPLRVFLRGGPKTHGEGEHDHPRFAAEWKPLLESRGAKVDAALEFPSAEALARTDVLVMYAADAGSIHGAEREHLAAYLARGGGIVAIHDAVCGDDPQWFKTVIGGAWEHGHSKWHIGTMGLYYRDFAHPITAGVANFDFVDELYTDLHLVPEAHVLASGFHTVFEITPQMWVYEPGPYRAFVSIQGHYWKSFENPAWRTVLLRGIAWAGKRDADSLITKEERAALRYPIGGPIAPDGASKGLVLQEGFDLRLVAAEPLVVKPISIDWGCRRPHVGRGDAGVSREIEVLRRAAARSHQRARGPGRRRPHGSLARLLRWARPGHEPRHARARVIATAAPDILSIQDDDGDGRADRTEVLYTGFGFGDTHAVISNLRWGLDGWIYATQGYSGNASTDVRHESKDGVTHFGRIGNGVLRFKPDGSAVELVSSYGSNTWGLDFDWDGELFFTMANGAHLRHVVLPERALAGGRLPGVTTWKDIADHDRVFPLSSAGREPYVQIDFVGGFTAASGSCIYTGGAWPEEYASHHFVAEPTVNLVHEDVLERSGVSYVAKKPREAEFLASTDPWFRPIHMRIGPDGAMYVLDFYNQAVVHNDTRGPPHGPTNAAVRPDRDHMHGRIWRVQHERARAFDPPRMSKASSSQLAQMLAHPNMWQRMTAERLLCERSAVDAAPTLVDLARGARAGDQDRTRVAALWTLARLGTLEPEVLTACKENSMGAVRRSAIRIGRERGLTLAGVPFGSGADERTRLEWIQALEPTRLDESDRANLIAIYGQLDEDLTRSLILSVASRAPLEFLATALEQFRSGRRPGSEGAAASFSENVAGIIGRSGDSAAAEKALRLFARQPPESSTVVAAGLRRLHRELKAESLQKNPISSETIRPLLDHDDFEVAIAALPFAPRVEKDDPLAAVVQWLGDRLVASAANPATPSWQRVKCMSALFTLPERRTEAIAAATVMLDARETAEMQLAAIEELGRVPEDAAGEALARAYPALGEKAREQAFNRIVARPRWVEALLAEIEAKRIAVSELGPRRRSQLEHHPDEATARRAQAVLGAESTGEAKKIADLVASLLPAVEQPGDVAHGKKLFAEQCGNCHLLRGEGGRVGPDLTGMGAHGPRALLPVILDPNAMVEAAYVEYVATTADERMVSGLLVRDTPEGIVLRSTSGDVELPRDEIASLRSTGRSPMPTGLEALGAEALRDILAYMAEDYPGFRLIDLAPLCDASTSEGMYDVKRDKNPMHFVRYGVVDVDGVPFEILDPARAATGWNVLALKGGRVADWESKARFPQRAEVPVGFALERVHVLGGIAAWGFPFSQDKKPAVKWTWRYADGASEEVVLRDGTEFADWIGQYDVPGSKHADGLVRKGSAGQVRTFSVAPSRRVAVDRIVLESYDNELSPTFVALTAELAGARPRSQPEIYVPTGQAPEDLTAQVGDAPTSLDWFIVGGGSSHDFGAFFRDRDLATLESAGLEQTEYTEATGGIARQLTALKVLELCNNQPIPDATTRLAIFDFVARGGGLLILHPAAWYNWADWPEYNARLVGGGARSHENYAEFEVRIVDARHPLAANVPARFTISDELYRFERDSAGAAIHVIAIGRSLSSGAEFPVVWTVERRVGRTACITLGHDAAAHEHLAFQTLLKNCATWLRND